ncbi:hypothetical protein YC2023_052410 [Brassica napus]
MLCTLLVAQSSTHFVSGALMILPYGQKKLETVGAQLMTSMIHGQRSNVFMLTVADLCNKWAAYAGLMVYVHLRSQKVFSAGVTPSALELLITLVYIALDPHMLEVRKTY